MDPPSQANGESATIPDENEEEAYLLLDKVIPPVHLKESAGDRFCCIYRIPHTLKQVNDKAYAPKIVSIGPYHHSSDKQHLKMIEEHKKRYLEMFVSKTKENGVYLIHLVDLVSGLEQKIRDSYSENLEFSQQKLIKVMLLDGCFILMLFLVVSQKIEYTNLKDPIFKLRWILPTLRSDLLLLENQVPLFLLKVLLETSKLAPSTSLNMLAFKFFDYSIKKPEGFWEKHNNLRAKHLLDLIRKTFIPAPPPSTTPRQCCINIFNGPREYSRTETSKNICLGKISCSKEITGAQTSSPPPPPRRPFLGLIVSARKLRLRGIKFMRKENVETPLDISFKSGLVEIPLLVFDDFISNLLINCVAFEQFNMSCSTEITSFVIFMGCLINTEDDATFLIEKGILENYFGTGEEVSLFFKNIGKDISFSISKSFLSNVFEGVNEYTSQGYHVHWAGFKYTHFNTPWTFLSSCAALVLLLLTIFQAFFAAYAYFRPPKNN
ncbi:unnamed protein product [Arabidopsis thaliana]|jgi:hypothetical protein|uniref:Emb/CAB72473.1 n=1 Tax=Arabidopsis thaliana TaxID=3702 RepID=Q9FK84_ARATH|nr:transmembrane protein, putative (DUF247) [Arabidopsis thaliana]AED93041.1 transmembrane protein, putative (DUF247) [Arabidopsis thaliana]BAB09127.1 unnamed protein product [Arabidopsis thaliana]|eukprot:NP_974821.1 transmembrane protein, putative (DUF247) [Arabidopsis thaliana]